MDDERDIEEERGQEAATREEQEAEWALQNELAGYGAPTDSSSPEYKKPGEDDDPTSEPGMLWEGMEGYPLIDQLHQVLRFSNFAERQAVQIKELYRRGIDPSRGTFTLEVSVLESQALSMGLNLVGLFAPELGAEASSLLRRAASLCNKYEPTEEEVELLHQIAQDLQLEAAAKMIGLTPDEYRDAMAEAEADLTDAGVREATGGDPSLN